MHKYYYLIRRNEDTHEGNSDKMNEYNDADKQRTLWISQFIENIKEQIIKQIWSKHNRPGLTKDRKLYHEKWMRNMPEKQIKRENKGAWRSQIWSRPFEKYVLDIGQLTMSNNGTRRNLQLEPYYHKTS